MTHLEVTGYNVRTGSGSMTEKLRRSKTPQIRLAAMLKPTNCYEYYIISTLLRSCCYFIALDNWNVICVFISLSIFLEHHLCLKSTVGATCLAANQLSNQDVSIRTWKDRRMIEVLTTTCCLAVMYRSKQHFRSQQNHRYLPIEN